MPAYITGDRDVAAQNGEDAIIEYLLLSRCGFLVHNGLRVLHEQSCRMTLRCRIQH